MAEPLNDSRIIKPFLPSLSHLALVSVAIPLFNKFDMKTLRKVCTDIEQENPFFCWRCSREIREEIYVRAKKHLLPIPPLLRKRVLDIADAMSGAVYHWRSEHPDELKSKYGEFIFQWRSDGSIDRMKTAQQLILNENISIRNRFELACMHCLEETVQTLWAEMEASGQTEVFDAEDDSMVGFWVRWIRDGSRVPWEQALQHLNPRPITSLKSYSSFLPSLQPGDRQEILFHCLRCAKFGDFRLCLYTLTKEEEEQMLQRDAGKFLLLYLNWPLQSLFLETAEKVLKYFQGRKFKRLVNAMLDYERFFTFFDYHELFESFWNMSPEHLKEIAKGDRFVAEGLDDHFKERIKRKAEADE